MEGTTIGPYRLVRKIGEGGMGAVYMAEHTLVGRRAAIKVLLPEWSMRKDIVTRFFNEARAMSSVPDPGIVQMFDFGFHTDGCAYIVMELLEGETLSQRRKRLRQLSVADALRITRQIAGTLAAAHARGIIHRDLKPENVFIVRDQEALGGERPKLLDFGIAKLADEPDQSYTLPGQMLGTPVWMSPEQCRGAGELDERTDIYSLGCVLYALLTGRPPFKRQGIGELISAHMNDQPEAPSIHVHDLPPEVDRLVMRCLEKSADHRFPTMTALQEACEALLARFSQSGAMGLPSQVGVPLPAGFRTNNDKLDADSDDVSPSTLGAAAVSRPTLPPQKRSRRALVISGVAVVMCAVGGALIIGFGGDRSVPVAPTTQIETPAVVDAAPALEKEVMIPVVDAAVADAPIDAEPEAKPAAPVKKKRPKAKQEDLYEGR